MVSGMMARVDRTLPHVGEILVRIGQRVEPDEIVARALVPQPLAFVNVTRELIVPPAHVPQSMRQPVGASVAAGTVLARRGARTAVAPVEGTLTAIDAETGCVTIAPKPTSIELTAGVRGLIMDIAPYRGVSIETPAAQLYGAFGVGPMQSGVLQLLVTDPADQILPEMISSRNYNAIIIGGSGISAAALQRAVAEHVRGVVVGGIDEIELRAFLGGQTIETWRGGHSWAITAAESSLTILVTEGFGVRPMAASIFERLVQHHNQEAMIDGQTTLRAPLRRPHLIIPLSARTAGIAVEPPRLALASGARVRLLDDAYLGVIGRVVALPDEPRRLASYARSAAVIVQVGGEILTLARSAVEPLE